MEHVRKVVGESWNDGLDGGNPQDKSVLEDGKVGASHGPGVLHVEVGKLEHDTAGHVDQAAKVGHSALGFVVVVTDAGTDRPGANVKIRAKTKETKKRSGVGTQEGDPAGKEQDGGTFVKEGRLGNVVRNSRFSIGLIDHSTVNGGISL